MSRIIETSWGKARITGRLGQQHEDVLDAICWEHEKSATTEDGRIKLLVDPARVRRRANQMSGERFKQILQELRMADIEIIEPAHLACAGHLIDHIDQAIRADGTPITRFDPLSKGQRPLWRVELGKAFCKMVAGDIWIGYDPAKLAALQNGISQAVARHALTHKQEPRGGWTLDGLIRAVAGEIDGQAIRDRRRELRADAPTMSDVGIVLDGDRVRRVEQRRGNVEQRHGSVGQRHGAWSRGTAPSDTS